MKNRRANARTTNTSGRAMKADKSSGRQKSKVGTREGDVETRMTKTRMKLIEQICGYMVSVKVRLKLSAIYYADMRLSRN